MSDFRKLESYIKTCISRGLFPGAVVLVGDEKADLFFEAFGHAEILPKERPMTKDAIFDIASLTKPVATATAILLLQERKVLSLEDAISAYLPEFRSSPYEDVTIFELLIHTSGIMAWYPLYLVSAEPEDEISYLAKLKPRFERNKGVEYSCLNYLILGELVNRVGGMRLDAYSSHNIFQPLGMVDTSFLPTKDLHDRFVTTEVGNEYEKVVCDNYEATVVVLWRTYPIRGEVHDGNAYYGFRGVAGNAGLFSTARDLARFVRSILSGKSVMEPQTIKQMIKNHTVGLDQGRGIGWGVASRFAGQYFSEQTIGHTGFTGACLYADPAARLFVILLTNSVHPRVRKGVLDEVRPVVCNLAYQAARSGSQTV